MLRRPRGVDARPDRHAREHDRVRRGRRATAVRPFGFFEFALVGVPLLVGTIVVVRAARRAAPAGPDAAPRSRPDLSRHARTLARQYGLGVGDERRRRCSAATTGLAEVLIPPRSPFIGDRVFPGMITEGGDLVVARDPARARTTSARPTLRGRRRARCSRARGRRSRRTATTAACSPSTQPDLVRRQAVPFGLGAWEAIAVLVGMVVLLVTGIVPPAVAGLLAAGTLIVLRVLTMEQAYRAITWTTVVLVAGDDAAVDGDVPDRRRRPGRRPAVASSAALGPYALLAGLFVVTAVFGQLISNMATALIMIPIARRGGDRLGVDLRPVLMSVYGRGGGGAPDAGRDAGQPDGDGPGGLPVRRLLEARPRGDGRVLRRLRVRRAGLLAVHLTFGVQRQ